MSLRLARTEGPRCDAPTKRARKTSATSPAAPSGDPIAESRPEEVSSEGAPITDCSLAAVPSDAPTAESSSEPPTASSPTTEHRPATVPSDGTHCDRTVNIGTVVTLRNAHGHDVPEDLRECAVTVTDVDPERNQIQFVDLGKKKYWFMDAAEPVRARPLVIEPALQEWLQSAGQNTKCGHITRGGRPCSCDAPCPWHHQREAAAMADEDVRSRQRDKGICGVPSRERHRVCQNTKGECGVHAPDERRCASMLEDNTELRCWSYKQPLSDYCIYHQDFANLSVNGKEYADDCHRRSKPCCLDEFIERYYPTANAQSFPRRADFLAYLKRLSGHDNLWLVVYNPDAGQKGLASAKKIIGMFFPVRGCAEACRASTNHDLSDQGSTLRIEAADGGYAIKGADAALAYISWS